MKYSPVQELYFHFSHFLAGYGALSLIWIIFAKVGIAKQQRSLVGVALRVDEELPGIQRRYNPALFKGQAFAGLVLFAYCFSANFIWGVSGIENKAYYRMCTVAGFNMAASVVGPSIMLVKNSGMRGHFHRGILGLCPEPNV